MTHNPRTAVSIVQIPSVHNTIRDAVAQLDDNLETARRWARAYGISAPQLEIPQYEFFQAATNDHGLDIGVLVADAGTANLAGRDAHASAAELTAASAALRSAFDSAGGRAAAGHVDQLSAAAEMRGTLLSQHGEVLMQLAEQLGMIAEAKAADISSLRVPSLILSILSPAANPAARLLDPLLIHRYISLVCQAVDAFFELCASADAAMSTAYGHACAATSTAAAGLPSSPDAVDARQVNGQSGSDVAAACAEADLPGGPLDCDVPQPATTTPATTADCPPMVTPMEATTPASGGTAGGGAAPAAAAGGGGAAAAPSAVAAPPASAAPAPSTPAAVTPPVAEPAPTTPTSTPATTPAPQTWNPQPWTPPTDTAPLAPEDEDCPPTTPECEEPTPETECPPEENADDSGPAGALIAMLILGVVLQHLIEGLTDVPVEDIPEPEPPAPAPPAMPPPPAIVDKSTLQPTPQPTPAQAPGKYTAPAAPVSAPLASAGAW